MNHGTPRSPRHGAPSFSKLALAVAMLSASNAFADVESPHNFGRPDINDDSSNDLLQPLSVDDDVSLGMAFTGSPHFVTDQHPHFDADLSLGTLQFDSIFTLSVDGRIPDTGTVVLDSVTADGTAGLAARTLSDTQGLMVN
jgi:hypothetical protein